MRSGWHDLATENARSGASKELAWTISQRPQTASISVQSLPPMVISPQNVLFITNSGNLCPLFLCRRKTLRRSLRPIETSSCTFITTTRQPHDITVTSKVRILSVNDKRSTIYMCFRPASLHNVFPPDPWSYSTSRIQSSLYQSLKCVAGVYGLYRLSSYTGVRIFRDDLIPAEIRV